MANKVWVYDIEIFKNLFTAVFIDYYEYHKIREPLGKIGKLKVSEVEKIAAINEVPCHVFQISAVDGHDRNDVLSLLNFINQDDYLCGFNSKSYDDNMLKFIIININKFKSVQDICSRLYEFSKLMVESDFNILKNIPEYKAVNFYHTRFKSIDLQRIPALDKVFKSLKQTLINLQWHQILDYEMPPISDLDKHFYNPDMPLDLLSTWDRYIVKEYVEDLIHYNTNDVLGTCELFYALFKHIKLRFDIGNTYGIYVLCDSDSKLADRFISKYYCEAAGVEFKEIRNLRTYRSRMNLGTMISPAIEFKTKEFNDLLMQIANTTVSTTKDVNIAFTCDITTYDIKSGGLHSRDNPKIFNSNDDIIYRDADVASYYPTLTINNQVAPKHLNAEIFVNVCTIMKNERIDAKRKGDMVKANSLKITINVGMFGKFGFEYSFLFDLKCTLTITINGQLALLMLIERLSMIGIPTISANTDGIVVELPRHLEDVYYTTCKQWEKDVNLELEYTDYIKYVRRDVNNYITVKKVYFDEKKHKSTDNFDREDEHGKFMLDVKRKGQLNQFLQQEDLKKGFNMPIIAKAVEEYFVNDVPVRDTIMNESNIYLFCATQNINKKYTLEFHKVVDKQACIDKLQRNCRFFMSNSGGLLFKLEAIDDFDIAALDGSSAADKRIGIMAGKRVQIFNDYYAVDNMRDYDIDYSYYVVEAQKRVDVIRSGISGNRTKDKKARGDIYHTGILFDM